MSARGRVASLPVCVCGCRARAEFTGQLSCFWGFRTVSQVVERYTRRQLRALDTLASLCIFAAAAAIGLGASTLLALVAPRDSALSLGSWLADTLLVDGPFYAVAVSWAVAASHTRVISPGAPLAPRVLNILTWGVAVAAGVVLCDSEWRQSLPLMLVFFLFRSVCALVSWTSLCIVLVLGCVASALVLLRRPRRPRVRPGAQAGRGESAFASLS